MLFTNGDVCVSIFSTDGFKQPKNTIIILHPKHILAIRSEVTVKFAVSFLQICNSSSPMVISHSFMLSWIFKYHVRVRVQVRVHVHVHCRFNCCQENIDL